MEGRFRFVENFTTLRLLLLPPVSYVVGAKFWSTPHPPPRAHFINSPHHFMKFGKQSTHSLFPHYLKLGTYRGVLMSTFKVGKPYHFFNVFLTLFPMVAFIFIVSHVLAGGDIMQYNLRMGCDKKTVSRNRFDSILSQCRIF